jgi:hypothetical protein
MKIKKKSIFFSKILKKKEKKQKQTLYSLLIRCRDFKSSIPALFARA